MKKFLLFMLGALMALPGIARDFTYEYEGQTLKYTVLSEEAKTCEVTTEYNYIYRLLGDLEIPAMAKDGSIEYSVTSIGNGALSSCERLTSVIIPNSVTSIGNEAFLLCSKLPSVTIPNSVTSIGDYAFYKCFGLTSVTIPNSVTSISYGTFYDCSKLSSVTIPNSVTSIGDYAFYNCSSLTSVTIPNSVTTIGENAFNSCRSLTSVTIPSSVNSIGNNAFQSCTGLKKSAYPDNLENPFSKGAAIAYPAKEAIFENGFIYGPEKKTIYLAPLSFEGEYNTPNSVTKIGNSAFASCTGLTSVAIPNSVTEIGNSAFASCTGLTSVAIPNSVTEIGNEAFRSCTGLKNFIVQNGESPIKFGENTLSSSPIDSLHMGRNWSYSNTESIFSGSLKRIEISNFVTELPEYAFDNCRGLTSVTIPNSVTWIGNFAFYNCSGLTSVTIPNSVTSIGNSAFRYCSGLTSVTIPNSVTSIGNYAFYNCTGLTSVTIPNSVTSIGEYAFGYCSGLTSVIIGNSVTSIGEDAFYKCSGLKKSAYPDNLENPFSKGLAIAYQGKGAVIEDGFVYGHEKKAIYFAPVSLMGEYVIPNSVIEIGNEAFQSCTGLTSVTLGNSVTSIGNKAFQSCTGLTSVTLGNPVTSIGNEAFRDCSGLTSVIIGNSVTSIGNEAFRDCSGLTSLIIGNSVTSIGEDAFYKCSGLKKLAYPDNLKNPFPNRTSIAYPAKGAIIEDGFVYGPEKNAIYFAPVSLKGEYIIPNSVTSIGEDAFGYCSGLTSVTIPTSVTSISNYAFESSSLKELRIEDSSESLSFGYDVFYDCELATVYKGRNFSYSASYSSYSPFYGQQKLTNLTISNYVTSIGKNAFDGCSGLTSVTIPNSVTSIDNYAFYNCSGLKSVTLGSSVTSIGENAFYGCSGITSVKSDNVTPPTMDDKTFEGRYAEASLSVPDNAVGAYLVTNWALFNNIHAGDSEEALGTHDTGVLKYHLIPAKTADGDNLAVVIPGDYSTLTEVTIPERFTVTANGSNTRYYVDAIGYKAFNGCSKLATVTFNSRNASKVIGDYAFAGTNISAITIPKTVETIGNYAFYKCTALTDFSIPEGVETLGNHAFENCSAIRDITIPGSVRTIGDYAFYNIGAISTLVLNEGLEYIGEYAFQCNGSSIQSIYIPSTLKAVGKDAFNFYRNVNISDLAAWCNIDFANANANPASGKLITLKGKTIENLVIPESVTEIKPYTFYKNSALKSAVFNDGLQSIGQSAFYRCAALDSVAFNDGLQSIGQSAFYGCTALDSVAFNDGLQSIGSEAFSGCTALYSVAFNNELQSIGQSAFRYCAALDSVAFNDGLQSIDDYAFYNSGLKEITIPGSVTRIGEYAFRNTSSVISFAYGTAPVKMATNSFSAPSSLIWDRPVESLNLDVTSLKSLTVGNSVTEIPAAKFKGISSLASLTLGSGLKTIGDEAFSGCTGLTEVIVPPSVESIGASAFSRNTKLTSIIMGHSVKSIGEKVFDLCPAQTVSITAQTPPAAPDNTFSNYTGSLYVQGEKAADAYYDADYCWYQFEGHVMIEATEIKYDGETSLKGKAGDTFQLKATLYPENVTLPQIFWRSTNPDIATVDQNGLVTLHKDMDEVMALAEDADESATSCKIIAETLYADGPVLEVTVNGESSGIDGVIGEGNATASGEIDFSAPVEVYSLSGAMVGTNLQDVAPGMYIVRQGGIVRKIAVK